MPFYSRGFMTCSTTLSYHDFKNNRTLFAKYIITSSLFKNRTLITYNLATQLIDPFQFFARKIFLV